MIIREYQPGDEEKILVLEELTEAHPWNRRNIVNWLWKYRGENPAGHSIVYVCENDNEIVAHFAVIPVIHWINGDHCLGSHSIAAMVKPEWQSRGLIKYVADQVLADTEKRGFLFTYGYPNQLAYPLHIRLMKYEDVSMQKLFQCSIQAFKQEKLSSEMSHFLFKPITHFDHEADKLWILSREKYKAAVVRNALFLNWRYLQRPDVQYHAFGAFDGDKLYGFCILKLYQEKEVLRGHFVDIFTDYDNKNVFTFLLVSGISFFIETNCSEVNLWLQGHAEFQQILLNHGFDIVSERPFICRFNNINPEHKEKLSEKDWYFTMGDTLEIY